MNSKRVIKIANMTGQLLTGEATAVGIYYEDGNDSDRRARIAVDPENSQNHVLQYGLKNARSIGQKTKVCLKAVSN